MADPQQDHEQPDWTSTLRGLPTGSLEHDSYLFMLQLDFSPQSQLAAIRSLLRRNADADEALEAEIRQLEDHAKTLEGVWNEAAVDNSIDLMHQSVYQDATHSLAAVGMLAPFIETIFSECFGAIGQSFSGGGPMPSRHIRWTAPAGKMWDCHYLKTRKTCEKNLVEGIMQLSAATDLSQYLPADLKLSLTALYEYRNKMFHNGLEWPTRVRTAFQKRITEAKWPPEWFSRATSGGEPWVFYMSQQLIDHCLQISESVLDGFSSLLKARFLSQYYEQVRG